MGVLDVLSRRPLINILTSDASCSVPTHVGMPRPRIDNRICGRLALPLETVRTVGRLCAVEVSELDGHANIAVRPVFSNYWDLTESH